MRLSAFGHVEDLPCNENANSSGNKRRVTSRTQETSLCRGYMSGFSRGTPERCSIDLVRPMLESDSIPKHTKDPSNARITEKTWGSGNPRSASEYENESSVRARSIERLRKFGFLEKYVYARNPTGYDQKARATARGTLRAIDAQNWVSTGTRMWHGTGT